MRAIAAIPPTGVARASGKARGALLEAITRGPIVLDAALGTRLVAEGLDLDREDPALWNLTHPERVLAIHRADVAAGANALLTNTFGASSAWLGRYGAARAVATINRRAVALARLAGGRDCFVLGDIGPAAAAEARSAASQAALLFEAGVDGLLFETFRAPALLAVLGEVRRTVSGSIPLLASLCEWPLPPEETARRLLEAGAAVLGSNCCPGMRLAQAFAARLHRAVSCPLLVKPSATPSGQGRSSPAAFAAAVPGLLRNGVRLLGGCCGTTDQHVAALASACAAESNASLRLSAGAAR
jgi:5-methyltetrahydrofolate--homocysteine methyltransferase